MATKSRSRLIRRIAYVLVGLVVIGFIVSRVMAPKPGPEYITAKVEAGDLSQTVALTGTTEPKTRYQLQFPRTGTIDKILVEVGGVVKKDDVLAVLQNDDAKFQLESQKAALHTVQANLAKAIAGQRPEEVQLSQLKVDLAQLDVQNSNVSKQNLIDLAQKNVNSAYLAVQAAKTSLEQAQDQYNYTLQTVQMDTWQQPSYQVYDSGYYYGDMRGSLPQSDASSAAGGNSSGYQSAALGGGSYVSNVNSIQTAQFNVQKAQIAFDQAQETYDKAAVEYKRQTDDVNNLIDKANVGLQSAKEQYKLTVAKPREVDIAPIKAQVDQAWVGVNLAQYQLDQTELKAPTDGIVTAIASDPGEAVSMAQPLVTLDSKYLHIKALVSEADIVKIRAGQNVTMTFDAFGTAREFQGNVYEVDPSETIVQGVVYYVVKVQFNAGDEAVKPGMTANLTIQTDHKTNALKVPARAVQYDANQAYVQVLKTVDKKQEIEKRNVGVGLQGDEFIEITSGLQEGEDVVTFTKSN